MRHWKVILLGIVLLAAVLRLWQLGNVPVGVHADEAAYAYNAYALLLTGKDEYGTPFPYVLKSFGEYKPSLYAYLTIPWVASVGLTAFAVRITAALFGIFTIVIVYFLTNKIIQNQKVALLAAFLLAISPWHITLSRTTSEVVVSVFFILMMLYAIFSLKEKFTQWWFILAFGSGILAMASYTASRFFVILLTGILLLFSFRLQEKKIHAVKSLAFLLVIFICVGIFTAMLDQASRFNQISILSSPTTKLHLEEQLREDQFTKPLVTRIFHNKIVAYTRTVTQNYAQYFTLDFLALDGGYPFRVKIPDIGVFYLWQMPFLIVGIYTVFRKRTWKYLFLLVWWVVLLIPAAFTYDEIPNVYRALVILPPLVIIIAIGMMTAFTAFMSHPFLRRSLFVFVLLCAVWEGAYFQHQYYIHQEMHRPWYRDYAYGPLVDELEKLSPHYKQIVMTKGQGGAYIGLLFHSKYDPKTYQAEGSLGDTNNKGFGKYIFEFPDCFTSKKKDVLYVIKGDCPLPKNFTLLETIRWQDHAAAFQLLEYASPSGSISH